MLEDEFSNGVIAMGFVSNAGACLVLLLTVRGLKATWNRPLFGLIAVGSAAAFFARNDFTTPAL